MPQLQEQLAFVHLLDGQSINHVDTVSSVLDLAGFNGAVILLNVGALTGVDTSNYLTPVLQESATTVGTDFTDVATAGWKGTFAKIDTTAKDQVTQYASYVGSKRYIRVNLDYTGTGITAGCVSVIGVLGNGDFGPVTAPAAITAS